MYAAAWALAAQQAYLLDLALDELPVEQCLKATNVAAPTYARLLGELGLLPSSKVAKVAANAPAPVADPPPEVPTAPVSLAAVRSRRSEAG